MIMSIGNKLYFQDTINKDISLNHTKLNITFFLLHTKSLFITLK